MIDKNPTQTTRRHPPAASGAHDRDRTGDLVLTKDALYRLSYVGPIYPSERENSLSNQTSHSPKSNRPITGLERVMGIEPTPSAWKAEVLPLNYTRPNFRRTDRAGGSCLRPAPTHRRPVTGSR